METILSRTSKEIIFWMAWIIIPLIMEIIPAFVEFIILIKKHSFIKKETFSGKFPEVTIIVPVYNSEATLRNCIKSIYESTYPTELLDVILVNNMSSDNSFQVYTKCQKEFKDLSLRYMNSKQGKSKALNAALFNSSGKYIINIDSDGQLHRDAIENIVVRFEQNLDINCMTGVILTNENSIENTKNPFLKILKECEFFEYAQAFLAGRNFESELNSVYTLSGAFSAFRKSTILKTQLYNGETVSEDTHITFQIRNILKQRVYLCENAIFFVEPIDNLNKLYTQRQRWQIGEIEVSHMFLKNKMPDGSNILGNFMIRVLLYDHTFAFPRMIWYFALIFLLFMNYPFYLVFGSIFIIYILYVLSAFLFYINVKMYLKQYKRIKSYYSKKVYLVFLMPLFNFLVFWIRFAGIINCINGNSKWKTLNLRDEYNIFCSLCKNDFSFLSIIMNKIRRVINDE